MNNKLNVKRKSAEKKFILLGRVSILLAFVFLAVFLFTIFKTGISGFYKSYIKLNIFFDSEYLELPKDYSDSNLRHADFQGIANKAIYKLFPNVKESSDKKELRKIISSYSNLTIKNALRNDKALLNKEVSLEIPLNSVFNLLNKGLLDENLPQEKRNFTDLQLSFFNQLKNKGLISKKFNWDFFKTGDSRAPEKAGIGGALLGSLFSMIICFLFSFPIGVATAIYLEEYAPKNLFTEFIEVNINNLAAIPSIIFGILGLSILIDFFELPRGTTLVGGLVLSLMTLPVIIVSCRAAIKAVPPSLKHAALGLGASKTQVVFHHVLPLALPGTLTGTIIGLARAVGETAPLLMIGMVAFVVNLPKTPLEQSTSLPVQIYLWAESAEQGFVEKTSAAIIVILLFLFAMNFAAVLFRNKFEKRW